MTHFNISIVSDTVCPWCYIGLRRFKSALAQHLVKYPSDTFSIQWHPFQLKPNAPKSRSVDKTRPQGVIVERLRSAGKDARINFSFGGRTGNTLDSHRLIEFARPADVANTKSLHGSGKSSDSLQTNLVEELFADYFEQEQDITDHDVLAKAADRVGLDVDTVRKFLAGNELSEQVAKEASAARSEGINGVPHFNINDVFSVEGAQEPAAFLMLFERLKKRTGKGGKALL